MRYILPILAYVLMFACKTERQKPGNDEISSMKENLIGMNKILLNKEEEAIEKFCRNKELKTKRSPLGVRFQIEDTNRVFSPLPEGTIVEIAYSMWLFDGTLCYEYKETDPRFFRIGLAETIRGIEEMVQFLHVGEEATMVIPSFLGYGAIGDEQKVPRSAPLFVKLKLIQIKSIPLQPKY